MSFVVGTTIALLFLDGFFKVLVIVAVALIEVVELTIWLRWRKVRATTGVEAMIGAEGVATTDCAPEGRVRVKGLDWKARCLRGVSAGDAIRVVGVEGLRLDVVPR
jgi:membrane-bound serine protease (ClpP class)